VHPGWLLAGIAAGFLLVSLAIAVLPARTAATDRVEQCWAELVSPAELEALRAALQRLLTELGNQRRSPRLDRDTGG
jgi:hypothetical protein